MSILTTTDAARDLDDLLAECWPARAIDADKKAGIAAHYDRMAGLRDRYRRHNYYYYRLLLKQLKFIIPAGATVLEVGCADGHLLRSLDCAQGVGIDASAKMIESARAGGDGGGRLRFVQADVECVRFKRTFDFVLLSDVLGTLLDVQQALENLRSACDDGTRVVIHYHGILWEPLLKCVERLGMKMPQPNQNWLSPVDMENLLTLADFERVRYDRAVLAPRNVPLVSGFLNRYMAPLPVFNALTLVHTWVVRKRQRQPLHDMSVSVVIPCRNEKGNIRAAVERLPAFGSRQEIIFVDGHSTDGTPEEIQRVIAEFPEKDIRFMVQQGRGKGDAVRLAFGQARHEVLMILDADLTMPPEDLPKFYEAISRGKGEFINGSRLVYPMEDEAMRFLNILGNKFFSVVLGWLVNQRLKDTLCGTKVLTLRNYERIAAARAYFGDFDPFGDFDLIFGAAKQNLRLIEVPVRYRDRTYGSTNISRFRHGFLLLRMSWFALRRLKWR